MNSSIESSITHSEKSAGDASYTWGIKYSRDSSKEGDSETLTSKTWTVKDLKSKAEWQKDEPKFKVLRRFRGFFVQDEGEVARVAIVKDNELIHYTFPSRELKKAQISIENQPFEMDEVETELDGVTLKGYQFRKSVDENSSYGEALQLDASQREKLDVILKAFK
jgi:hypothetical protein